MADNDPLQILLEIKDVASAAIKKFEKTAEGVAKKTSDGFDRVDEKLDEVNKSAKGAGGSILQAFSRVANVVTAVVQVVRLAAGAFRFLANIVTAVFKTAIDSVRAAISVIIRLGNSVKSMITDFLSATDVIDAFSRRLGIGVVELQSLQFAAEIAGVKVSGFNVGLQRMNRRIAEIATTGRGVALPALEKLGISIDELAGKAPDVQFLRLAKAFEQVEDQGSKVLQAFKFFDTEGVSLVQLFDLGVAGIDKLVGRFKELGAVITQQDVTAARDLAASIKEVQLAVEGVKLTLLRELSPALTEVFSTATETILNFTKAGGDQFREWSKLLSEIVRNVGDGLVKGFEELGRFVTKNGSKVTDFLKKVRDVLRVLSGAPVAIIRDILKKLVTNINIIGPLVLNALTDIFFKIGVSIADLMFEGMKASIEKFAPQIAQFLVDKLGFLVPVLKILDDVTGFSDAKLGEGRLDTSGLEKAGKDALTRLNELQLKLRKVTTTILDLLKPDVPMGKGNVPIDEILGLGAGGPKPPQEEPPEKSRFIKGMESVLQDFMTFGNQMEALGADIASSVAGSFEQLFFDVMQNNFKNLGEAVKNFAKAFLASMQSILAKNLAGSLTKLIVGALPSGFLGEGKGSPGVKLPSQTEVAKNFLQGPGKQKGGIASFPQLTPLAEHGIPELVVPIPGGKVPIEVRPTVQQRQRPHDRPDRRMPEKVTHDNRRTEINIEFTGSRADFDEFETRVVPRIRQEIVQAQSTDQTFRAVHQLTARGRSG